MTEQNRLPPAFREHRDALEVALAELFGRELRDSGAEAVYIVFASETDFAIQNGIHGLTSPELAVGLQFEIGERWRGDGPAMLVDDRVIRRDVGESFIDCRGTIAPTVAHEAAHWLEWLPWRFGGATSQDVADVADVIREYVASPDTPDETRLRRARLQHGPDFVRIVLHVAHRLTSRGFYVPTSQLLAWSDLFPHLHQWQIQRAIGDECARLADQPLSVVAGLAPPADFLALFLDDCRHVGDSEPEVSCLEKGNAMSEFFDRLKQTKDETVRQSAADWQTLVRRVADDHPPSESETVVTISRLGKTVSDLQHAVTVLQRRRHLRSLIDTAEQAQSELPHLAALESAANAEFAVAQAKHQRVCSPLLARREGIQNEQFTATSARDELLRLAGDSVQASELKASSVALDALRRQQLADADKRDDLLANLRSLASSGEAIADPGREVSQIRSSIARMHDTIAKRAVEIKEQHNANERLRARLFDADLVA